MIVISTHCAFVFDAVQPEIAGRELLPNDQGRPSEQHLPCAEHSPVGMVEG